MESANFDTVSSKTYHPRYYLNVTETNGGWLCVSNEDYIPDNGCLQTTVAPTQTYIDSLTSELQSVQATSTYYTVGCSECKSGKIPIVTLDDTLGLYIQSCDNTNNYDFTTPDVPCENLGTVQQWVGYI